MGKVTLSFKYTLNVPSEIPPSPPSPPSSSSSSFRFFIRVVNERTRRYGSTATSHVDFRGFVRNSCSRETSARRENENTKSLREVSPTARRRVVLRTRTHKHTQVQRWAPRACFFSSCYAASGNTYRMPVF